jgi:hypothetical protein
MSDHDIIVVALDDGGPSGTSGVNLANLTVFKIGAGGPFHYELDITVTGADAVAFRVDNGAI